MKHIDYLYFNIYNYFYRLSLYQPIHNPRLQTMYIFSLGAGGWLLLFQSLYLHLVKHARFASRGEAGIFAMSMYLLTSLLFYYVFIVRDRDQQIFGKYESMWEGNPKFRWHFVGTLCLLLMPYAGLLTLGILFPRR